MISSIAWVPAGVADPTPKRYEMSATEQELIRLMQEQGNISDKSRQKKDTAKKLETPIENNLPADLRMDEYSSDEDEGVALGNLLADKTVPISDDMVPEEEEEQDENEDKDDEESGSDDEKVDAADESVNSREHMSGDESDDIDDDDLADVPDTREFAPLDLEGLEAMGLSHISTNGAMYLNDLGEGEDDDSEAEDVRLTNNDALILVAKTEDDFASLEVNVYNTKKGGLYIHHDIPLPSYPLCLAHGQVSSTGSVGNFCAVGTFSPGIEIWNLDVLNALEPSCVLGGEDTTMADELMRQQMMSEATGQKPAKTTRRPDARVLRPGSHTDAVMALSWNQVHRQVIASGSADCTVKLWDVTQAGFDANGKCNAGSFSHHKDKVQSVEWHPTEGTLLATGSYDRTVALLDARSGGGSVRSVKIPADCEALAWDPCHPEYLTVASEDGMITCWDVRKFQTSTPLWSFVANEFGGVSDLSYNSIVPGLMATCSTDKTVTLWDTCSQNDTPTLNVPPRSCGSKDMCSGRLYSVAFYPSLPWLLGSGGSGNQIALWDLSGEHALQKRFETRAEIPEATTPVEEDAKQEEFEAMMAAKDAANEVVATEKSVEKSPDSNSDLKKKDKSKGKKKAPRKR